jgi:glycosyltransferase EpsD
MRWFHEQGWEVEVAAKGELDIPYCDVKHNIQIERSPIKRQNIGAYRELKRIIDQNNYDIVHVHTPVAGVLVRLAARTARKKGTKIFYTAHGFHFCKGAPIRNWLLYYPIERWLSRYTDCLITINEEDYSRAVRHKFKAGSIYRIHGVGVDPIRFNSVNDDEKIKLREMLGYKKEDFILFYVAELNKNKNQILLLETLVKAKKEIPNIKLLLIGDGVLMDYYKSLAKEIKVEDLVDFMGFRKDVDKIVKISDIAVASSYREGLPVNVMEAMACGKPVVATNNRGHRELIVNGYNGFLLEKNDAGIFAEKIIELYKSVTLRGKFKKATLKIVKVYTVENVMKELKGIYGEVLKERGNEGGATNTSLTCSS